MKIDYRNCGNCIYEPKDWVIQEWGEYEGTCRKHTDRRVDLDTVCKDYIEPERTNDDDSN